MLTPELARQLVPVSRIYGKLVLRHDLICPSDSILIILLPFPQYLVPQLLM